MAGADSRDAARGTRALAAVLAVGGLGTILYWAVFFTTGAVRAASDPCYLAFERAFPAADAWMAATCLLAGAALWRRRPRAVLLAVAAGSALVFLGLMDVLYNLEHGMYGLATAEMANELAINVYCLAVGPAAIACAWRWRRVLDPR